MKRPKINEKEVRDDPIKKTIIIPKNTFRLQHIIMFAMLKVDRVLASCLPFGKYPIFSVEVVSGVVLASWFVSFFIAGKKSTRLAQCIRDQH